MPAKYNTQTNVSIFNAVRSVMSEEFKARIPEATTANMLEVGTALTSQEFDVEFNAWQNALVNRIGLVLFFDYAINNPLAKYIYGDMAWGDAIEAIAADIVKGAPMDYGQEGKSIDPFVKCSPEAKAEYHRVMKPIQYCTTIEKDRIREAFTREGGLQRLGIPAGHKVNTQKHPPLNGRPQGKEHSPAVSIIGQLGDQRLSLRGDELEHHAQQSEGRCYENGGYHKMLGQMIQTIFRFFHIWASFLAVRVSHHPILIPQPAQREKVPGRDLADVPVKKADKLKDVFILPEDRVGVLR